MIENFLSEKEVKNLKDAGEKLTQNVPLDAKTVFTTSQTSQVNDNDVMSLGLQFNLPTAFSWDFKVVGTYPEYYFGRGGLFSKITKSKNHLIILNVVTGILT